MTARSFRAAAIARAEEPLSLERSQNGGDRLQADHGVGLVLSSENPPLSPQDGATGLRGGQSCLCPIGNHAGFVLGDGGEDVQGKTGGVQIVRGHKIDLAVHQRRNERDVPR